MNLFDTEIPLNLIIMALLLLVTLLTGWLSKRFHFASLEKRELIWEEFALSNTQEIPFGFKEVEGFFSVGSVVVGCDYYTRFFSGLKSIIGGNIRGIETYLERSRREALLRMAESARLEGATAVINVRLETTVIKRGRTFQGLAATEVTAYGTALKPLS